MSDAGVFTPYSTVIPLADLVQDVTWLPQEEQPRIQAYQTYDEMYWNFPEVYKVEMRGTFDMPVYVPNARTVVDETAHYLLKGLIIGSADPNNTDEMQVQLRAFLKRNQFYSIFHENKISGVCRGDWIFHMTADDTLPEGERISISTVDPAAYFPIYNDEDPDVLEGVMLVEQILQPDGETVVKVLRYMYDREGETRLVIREEAILKMEGWFDGQRRVILKRLLPPEALDPRIQRIPVYHFRNRTWQGDPFGSSELRGHERLLAAINQTVSDEELGLALEGLGVYATDAPQPEGGWTIAPGVVLEIPGLNNFTRVQGIRSVDPFLAHIEMLENHLYEGSATFRSSRVDVQLAESGIALAIKFMPTLAKIEQRDLAGLDLLNHLWHEWQVWHSIFEGGDFTDTEIELTLGQKLPTNRVETMNELNNMVDRRIISRAYYRQQMALRLGWVFPPNMEEEVIAEEEKFQALRIQANPAREGQEDDNQSNNADRPNESAGTEA